MLEKIKLALRIDEKELDDEISDLIQACRLDMNIHGVRNFIDTDALIIRASIVYCRAYFGSADKDYEKYIKSYEMLRNHMSMCPEYCEVVSNES